MISNVTQFVANAAVCVAQRTAHGGHKNRIHRSSESSLKCGSLQILVQSRFLWFAIAQVFNSGSTSVIYGFLGLKLYFHTSP
jgi:hypothetical protein